MSKVRGANPAAQRAADAAVAIEEQDVLAGLHDSHLGQRSADLNNSYVSKESLSRARRSSGRLSHDPRSFIGPRTPGVSSHDLGLHTAAHRLRLYREPKLNRQ